jgi:E-phenylitaconyl-CoA hydratase
VDERTALGELITTAEQIARDIAQRSPHAVSLNQQAIWGHLEMPYSQAFDAGTAWSKRIGKHSDFTEGAQAFVEKRTPKWSVGLRVSREGT